MVQISTYLHGVLLTIFTFRDYSHVHYRSSELFQWSILYNIFYVHIKYFILNILRICNKRLSHPFFQTSFKLIHLSLRSHGYSEAAGNTQPVLPWISFDLNSTRTDNSSFQYFYITSKLCDSFGPLPTFGALMCQAFSQLWSPSFFGGFYSIQVSVDDNNCPSWLLLFPVRISFCRWHSYLIPFW